MKKKLITAIVIHSARTHNLRPTQDTLVFCECGGIRHLHSGESAIENEKTIHEYRGNQEMWWPEKSGLRFCECAKNPWAEFAPIIKNV